MTLTEFLANFYPDADEEIWFRTFDTKKSPTNGVPHKVSLTRNRLKSDAELQQHLRKLNETQGIYFVVNAGGNEDADITRINAIFCEIDDRPLVEQHDIFDNASPWSPSIRVETRKSVHAYWLLSDNITQQDFLELQQGLIAFYNSDKSIKNLSRVMRVPFFNHVRYDNGYQYQRVNVHTYRPDWKYSLAELREGFPLPAPIRTPKWDPLPLDTFEGVMTELRCRIMALPSYRSHGQWGCANGVCHGGESNTALRINLASGAVSCWAECDLKTILSVFGLELPQKRGWQYVPSRQQSSELYQWYRGQRK